MARPKRPSKTASPSPSPLSLPGVALSLFAAVAAGFFASRAFKRRSQFRSAHLALAPPDFPTLLKSLPNASPSASPSSSLRFSNDEPAAQFVVRHEIAHEMQDKENNEKNEEQFPAAELRAVVAVERNNAADTKCSPPVSEIDTTAVDCNLEVEAPGQIGENVVTRELVLKSPGRTDQRPGSILAGPRVEVIPVEEDFNVGEKAGKHIVETVIVLKDPAEPNNSPIHASQGRSEERGEDQRSSEQSSVLINGTSVESSTEADSEEDHDGLSNGSTLSDCTGCSCDSECSLQEVTSAAVRPLDPCLEEEEDAKVGSGCGEVLPSEVDSPVEDCSAHGKESNELATEQATNNRAEAIEWVKEFSVKVDYDLNSDENGGVTLISPKYEVSIELLGNKQLCSVGHEGGQAQESVDSVLSNCEVASQLSDCEENSSLTGQEMSAASAFNEVQEEPQSSPATRNAESEEETAAENKQDRTREIVHVDAEMEALAESVDVRVFTKRECRESFDPEENLKEIEVLENNAINEGTLQLEEELDRCSSSEDTDVGLYSGNLDRKREVLTEVDTIEKSVESPNDMDTGADCLSSNSVSERNVWPSEQIRLDTQVLSETKASEQKEKQQTDQIFESKKFSIEDLNLSETIQRCTELSGNQIHASTTGQQYSSFAEIPNVKLQKGVLTKFAGHVPIEMTLIGVLIGLLSVVLWFLRSILIRDTIGVIAQN